nr:reverse transcriptase domain-containing protein [Tanacetum cinerariifolium]
MLNKDNYVPWSSRLLRYAKSKPNGKLIYNFIMHGPYVRRMIPKPGDPDRKVLVVETFHEQTDDELTEKEVKQMKVDDQAIQIILMGLPEDIYAAVDTCETALPPTNNNKRISSNPRNRQIAQLSINLGQDRHMQMVGGNGGNQFRQYVLQNVKNSNRYNVAQNVRNQVVQNAVQNLGIQNVGNHNELIVVPGIANPNANKIGKGNVIGARAKGHENRNYGIQVQVEEFDFMATVRDLEEIEEVNASCILMANLQQASTSVTSHSVPITRESKSVTNDKVISPEMFRINPFKTSKEEKFIPINKVRGSVKTNLITVSQPHVITKKDVNSDSNGLSSTGVDNTAMIRRPQPRSNTKNDRVPSASNSSCIKNKEVKIKEHRRSLLISKNKKHMSSECNNIKLVIRNDKYEVVYAMCKQCLNNANHDVCVLKYVNDMNSCGDKHSANASKTTNTKKHKPKGKKPKNVGFKERLASPKLVNLDLALGTYKKMVSKFFLFFGRTPQHNGVIERRNWTLVEAARTIKPDILFLHVFGALCYPKNDREDIRKLGAKGDIGFFIGYSANSRAYRVYNRRTKKFIETMNVTFDELSTMAFEQCILKPRLQSMNSRQITALRTAYVAQAPHVLQTLTAFTTTTYTAPTPKNSSLQAADSPNTLQDVDELEPQQQNVQQQDNQAPLKPEIVADMLDGNTFVNPFATPSIDSTESSSQYVDPSNMHTFYQPYPHEYLWSKDHPLKQVIREPSRPVLTRNQLQTNDEMCMYALTVGTIKPSNVKEVMKNPAWIDSMQELLQFKRLDSNYVLEIFKKYGMETCDPIGTPIEIKDKLDLDKNGNLVDVAKYHSMIGALMYLTSSRRDIVYATCLCAWYLAKPTEKYLKEEDPPEVSMDDNRTVAQLLQAPTVGYEDAIVIPEITATNFELNHGLIKLCCGWQFLDKMPSDCMKIIECKSKVRQSRAKVVVAKVNSNSSTPAISSNVAELKDMVRALLLDKKNQSSAPATSPTTSPAKTVESNCVTCGGSGTLPGNTVTNPKEDLKGITTQSGVAYNEPIIPTSSKVVKQVSKPIAAPVSAPMPNLKPSIPYSSRRDNERRRELANEQIEKFYEIFKDMSFEISFTDALILMPKFASTLKSFIRNKEKLSEMARTPMNEHCSAVILNKLPKKPRDPGKFLIPYEFHRMDECLALADLGASINLMPLSVWKELALLKLTPTCMTLELADRSVSKPIGIAKDVSVKTGRALIDVHKGELTLRIRNEAITYNLDQTSRYSANYDQMTANKIDVTDEACEEYFQEVLGFSNVTASGSPTGIAISYSLRKPTLFSV